MVVVDLGVLAPTGVTVGTVRFCHTPRSRDVTKTNRPHCHMSLRAKNPLTDVAYPGVVPPTRHSFSLV